MTRWVRCLWASALVGCGSPTDALVLHNASQPRWAEVISCDGCRYHDLGADPAQAVSAADFVVLDGHSIPGVGIVGRPEAEVLEAVRRADPETVVTLTCYGAELQFLEGLFASAPRLDRVLATPQRLTWSTPKTLDRVLEGGPGVEETGLRWYDRELVSALRVAADAELVDVAQGLAPTLLRISPTYLRINTAEGSWTGLRVDPAQAQWDLPLPPSAYIHANR